MKILHVITGMQKAAGTTTFVENVVRGLQVRGNDVEVVMSADRLETCDIIHIHGLWSGLMHKASKFARKHHIPVVWSTHGMTAPWSMRHKWWKKWPAWWLYQKRDLQLAAAIHCTVELEVEWNKALGFERCFVAPLGTSESVSSSWSSSSRADGESLVRSEGVVELGVGGKHTLLFVGRIYPVKAIDRLIQAFAMVPLKVRQDWRLLIVGPDQARHLADLNGLVAKLGMQNVVEFPGSKFGAELKAEYDSCDCLALVSHTENFGATVVDAMAHGKPVITSNKTPWREVVERGCGWWVSNEPEQLAVAIHELMALSDAERRAMGERGRKLVEERYTWEAVVKQLEQSYEEVLNART